MSDFKKFIETGGKSLEEIKLRISELVKNTIESNLSAFGQTISPRGSSNGIDLGDDTYHKNNTIKAAKTDIPESPQTEEIRSKAENGSFKPEKIPVPQTAPASPENNSDSSILTAIINRKIISMRKLAETRVQTFYLHTCVEMTFLRQGEFMAYVEDHFPQRVYCAVQRPTYDSLTDSQLRTYLTWRTEVRGGVYNEIDRPYTRLYCYELLNKIGVPDSTEAFRRLVALWENYNSDKNILDDMLPVWIRDFCAYNDVSLTLPEQLLKSELDPYLLDLVEGRFDGKLRYFAENSSYNVLKSSAINNATRPILDRALAEVLTELRGFFTERNYNFTELLGGRFEQVKRYRAFAGAFVSMGVHDGLRRFVINETERYVPLPNSEQYNLEHLVFKPPRGFFGYILKSTEDALREFMGLGRKLTLNLAMCECDFSKIPALRAAVNEDGLDAVIKNAVERFCIVNGLRRMRRHSSKAEVHLQSPSKPVEIDVSKLGEIRRRADEITEKLVISEDEIDTLTNKIINDDFGDRVASYSNIEEPYIPASQLDGEKAPSALGELSASQNPDFEEAFPDRSAPEKSASEEAIPQKLVLEKKAPRNPAPEKSSSERADALREALSGIEDFWADFAVSLADDDLKLIEHAIDGSLARYCGENHIFAEPYFDRINNAALGTVGDVVFENGEIVFDYKKELSEIIAKSKAIR